MLITASAAAVVPEPRSQEVHPSGEQLPSNAPKWQQDGRAVPDEAWRRADGPFAAMLLVTDEPNEFLEAWARPASPDYKPYVHRVSETRRGGVVAAMILFARCAPDASGNCRSVVDFRVLRPDGSVYAEHRAPLWDGAPPPYTSLQLGTAHMVFEVEPSDPLGSYRIEAIVRDQIAKRRVALSQELSVLERQDRPSPEALPAAR